MFILKLLVDCLILILRSNDKRLVFDISSTGRGEKASPFPPRDTLALW